MEQEFVMAWIQYVDFPGVWITFVCGMQYQPDTGVRHSPGPSYLDETPVQWSTWSFTRLVSDEEDCLDLVVKGVLSVGQGLW